MRIPIFLMSLSLLCHFAAHAEEQTVRVTVFTLKDGRTVEALRYVSANACYRVTTVGGEKLLVNDDDVRSTLEKRVALSSLPEELRPVSPKFENTPAARAARIEEPAEVTVFTLRDGRTVEAVDVNEQDGQFVRYSIILTNGRTVQFSEADIVSRTVKQTDFSALPKQMQEELGAAREIRRRSILKAAQNENDKTYVLQQAMKRVTNTENERKLHIDQLVDGDLPYIDTRIAYEDARYDGLKTYLENQFYAMSATTIVGGPRSTLNWPTRNILQMDQAAQEKCVWKHKAKVLSDEVAEYKQLMNKLTADMDAAQKDVDAAKEALARAKATKPKIYAFDGNNPVPAAANPAPAKHADLDEVLFGARKKVPKDE